MTFTQIQSLFVKALRAARKVYRQSSTAGEKLEREFDRLIKREHGQLIQPEDVKTALLLWAKYNVTVSLIPKAFQDLQTILSTPVVA